MQRTLELTETTPVLVEYAFGMGRKVMPFGDYQDIPPAKRESLASRLKSVGRADHSGDTLTIASLLPPAFFVVKLRTIPAAATPAEREFCARIETAMDKFLVEQTHVEGRGRDC